MSRSSPITGISLPHESVAERWLHSPAAPAIESVAEMGAIGLGTQPRGADSKRWSDDPRLPACLLSTILHTVVLLVLALWTYSSGGDPANALLVRLGPASETMASGPFSQIEPIVDSANEAPDTPVEVQVPSDDAWPSDLAIMRLAPTSRADDATSASATSADSPVIQIMNAISDQRQAAPGLVRLPSSSSLAGRTGSQRRRVGEIYGATQASEEAVELALAWLAEHQRTSGAWSFDLTGNPCDGRCRDSKKKDDDTPTPSTAATGLALLAFLGAGYTHEQGQYAEVVQKGLYYLRSAGAETQSGIDWQQGSMYGHGMALMAVSEATAMTARDGEYDTELRDLALRGTNFTCAAQHKSGSWGYIPGSPGDTTLTGWQVLSLVAAKRNKISLPSLTMSRAKNFVFSTSPEGRYSFGYKGPPGEPTTTAIGLTLLLYLGEMPGLTPFDNAMMQMAQRGPTLTNVYHDYYATLALHHVRHPLFDEYFGQTREHLIATQVQTGHEKGSWHFKDKWGDIGGRLYTTAMSVMILEVPYRYLPLYDSNEDFPL